MKQLLFICLFFYSCTPLLQVSPSFAPIQTFQLVSPKIQIDSIFFQHSTTVQLVLDHPDTHIHYTTDGTEVTEKSPLYNQSFELKESRTIKAKAFHSDFLVSETTTQNVLKTSHLIEHATIRLAPSAHEKYAGAGISSLSDLKKGSTNFRSNKAWLGFQTKRLKMEVEFAKVTTIHRLILSALEDNGAWIFLPQKIIIRNKGEVIGEKTFDAPKSNQAPQCHFLNIPLIESNSKMIEIEIVALTAIPDWHVGKGGIPWLFLDELLIE